jgi:hypothetical protein
MNMKLRTDQNTIEELSDSDDLMATDVAGITKNTTTAKNQLGDDTDTHERSSTCEQRIFVRATNKEIASCACAESSTGRGYQGSARVQRCTAAEPINR